MHTNAKLSTPERWGSGRQAVRLPQVVSIIRQSLACYWRVRQARPCWFIRKLMRLDNIHRPNLAPLNHCVPNRWEDLRVGYTVAEVAEPERNTTLTRQCRIEGSHRREIASLLRPIYLSLLCRHCRIWLRFLHNTEWRMLTSSHMLSSACESRSRRAKLAHAASCLGKELRIHR